MTQFQHHPDGLIYVRGETQTYSDTVANFALDFGQPEPALPAGAISRDYNPGVCHSISDGTSVIAGGPMPWAFGDSAIAAVGALLTAQDARNPKADPQSFTPPPIASPRQIRLALTQIGLRTAVENYVAAATQDVKDSWQFATQIDRNNALLNAAAIALGKTSADIDALFALAMTL